MSSLVEKNAGLIDLIARILLGILFLGAGVNKFSNMAWTESFLASMGMPAFLAPIVAAFEVVAGLAIIVGFWTRLWSFLLGGFCVVTALAAHMDFGDQVQTALFMKNLAIAGGFGILLINGAGPISVDGRGANA